MSLSEDLAGVTLMAFGNGANDVMSAFVAGSEERIEGAFLALGSTLGSLIFTTTVVTSLVIICSKTEVKVLFKFPVF